MSNQTWHIGRKHQKGWRWNSAVRRRPAKTGGAEDGMSLIELLVVLAVLALVAAIALPRAQTLGRGPSVGMVASDIAVKLRTARSLAIAQNRDVSFVLDTDTRTYDVAGTGAPQSLPAAVDLSVTTARSHIREIKETHLVFFSDGTSSGGTIRLTDHHQTVAVVVEWLTGAVHIERGAR
jgi:general secretion pathway protein H